MLQEALAVIDSIDIRILIFAMIVAVAIISFPTKWIYRAKFHYDCRKFTKSVENSFVTCSTMFSEIERSRNFADDPQYIDFMYNKYTELFAIGNALGAMNKNTSLELVKNLNLVEKMEELQSRVMYFGFSKEVMEAVNTQKDVILQQCMETDNEYLVGYYNGIEMIVSSLERRSPQLVMRKTIANVFNGKR